MTARVLKREMRKARERIAQEIREFAAHSRTSAGLAGEGYAGGYRDALEDALAVLEGRPPSDIRNYWGTRDWT